MNIAIREAISADGPILAAIEGESFRHPHWQAEHFLRYDCIVAEANGQIAGFLVSRKLYNNNATQNECEHEILNIAVAPRFRRIGVATALLKHELAKRGSHFLEVRVSNTGAQSLYRKLGFVQLGIRPNYYDNPSESAIVMTMK